MTPQKQATFRIWRCDAKGGAFRDYTTGISDGMVVLDAVNHIQATQANDLACRWNCKAGKCGSWSAEINGKPRPLCMTRKGLVKPGETINVAAGPALPVIPDLITDPAFHFRKAQHVTPLRLKPAAVEGT